MRLTVGQALVRFLTVRHSERDGVRQPFFAGCWGIFGHGKVAGLSQALLEAGDSFRYYQTRNGQAMVHAAAGYARMTNRLRPSPARPRSAPVRRTWSPEPRWPPSTGCWSC